MANATDVTSEVGRLIRANPDVLMHAPYITDAILFTKTFRDIQRDGIQSPEHADEPPPAGMVGKVG